MRLALLFLVALAAIAASTGERDSLSWIGDAGGAVTRDPRGRVVAVDLHASWAGDSDLASLANVLTLTHLDLSQTRIGDHGLRQLKNAPAITDLNLRYAELITDEGISALKTWKHLKRLDLEGTKITDNTLQHLAALSSLEALDIGYAGVTDSGVDALASLSNLKELTLGGNKLTDAGLQPLRQLPNLTDLDLGGVQREDSGMWSVSFAQPGLEAIATLKDLRRLRLQDTMITARGLETIETLPRLESLDLHDCERIGDDAVPILASMRALRWVDLTDTKITAAALEKLRRAKPDCRILKAASSPKPEPQTAER